MRLCFIGDSFVAGIGDPAFQGWTGRLCAGLGGDVTCYTLGIRRDTSADIAARWRAEAERRLPPPLDGRLVFSFGVNDCVEEDGRSRVAFADSLANARTVLAEAAAWRPTLMVGPPPIADAECNRRIAHLSGALDGLCAGLGVPYLPVFDALARSLAWMAEAATGDGAHPGEGGYKALALLVSAWPAWRAWADRGP